MDPGGFPIVSNVDVATDTLEGRKSLDVACTNTTCLVGWTTSSYQVFAMRVTLSGMIVDATPIELRGGTSPRITATDDRFLIGGGYWMMIGEQGQPQRLSLRTSVGTRQLGRRMEWPTVLAGMDGDS